MLSNQLVGGDPQTPIFTADIGDQARFRLTHPFGTGTSQVFTVHGHVWQRNPYQNNSTVLGDNNLSQWMGSRDNHGSTDHFDLVIDKAGGEFGQGGDYLIQSFNLFRQVRDPGASSGSVTSADLDLQWSCVPADCQSPGMYLHHRRMVWMRSSDHLLIQVNPN